MTSLSFMVSYTEMLDGPKLAKLAITEVTQTGQLGHFWYMAGGIRKILTLKVRDRIFFMSCSTTKQPYLSRKMSYAAQNCRFAGYVEILPKRPTWNRKMYWACPAFSRNANKAPVCGRNANRILGIGYNTAVHFFESSGSLPTLQESPTASATKVKQYLVPGGFCTNKGIPDVCGEHY